MLAKPICDRQIYKAIRKNRCRSLVEIGLGDGSRSVNMIRVAQKFAVSSNVKYTGIDLFDSRENSEPKLSLIEVHRQLKAIQGVKVQLVPGEMGPAIARIANSHVRTDLIVISNGVSEKSLEQAWFYFPRMLQSSSIVMTQRQFNGPFETLNRLQVEKLTANRSVRRAA